MEAIVICGFPSSGKTTVSNLLGEKLSLKVVGGGDILKEMATTRGYAPSGNDWWDTEEGIRFSKEREKDLNFDKEADRILRDKIERGNIIITSYVAPWLVEKGFKIWLEASIENRAERMTERDKLSLEECIRIIKIRDKENNLLYKKLYNIDFGKDLSVFDMAIDTNDKTAADVADLIIEKLNAKKK